jgi:serine protease AprX
MWRLIILFFLNALNLSSQVAPGAYLVEFTDKAHNNYSLNQPETFLSERALDRRQRQGIAIDSTDLPVSAYYLDSLKAAGFTIQNTSRWLNSAILFVPDDTLLLQLDKMSFIKNRQKSVRRYTDKSTGNKFETLYSADSSIDLKNQYGYSWDQIHFHEGEELHLLGYKGKGMQIAVIDAGFLNANKVPALADLLSDGRIIAIRDFVTHDGDVYMDYVHGMYVLSIMAGNISGTYIGTAPEASFYLLRSENAASEYIIEEDNWLSAAEFADSSGADIITSSLGYTTFTDPSQNHSYADMNGSSRVSRGADMAFSKGMMVIISAGNEGSNPWHYISAPSDAIHAISVGAADKDGIIADFSSRGFSPDGRVKPDLISVGYKTWVQNSTGGYGAGNGTSFASPIISGLTACLWQANPSLTNTQIRTCILESCSHYTVPDTNSGYGIPDFKKAYEMALLLTSWPEEKKDSIRIAPNPFINSLHFTYYNEQSSSIEIAIYNLSGICFIRKIIQTPVTPVKDFMVQGLDILQPGFYILSLRINGKFHRFKLQKQ